MIGSILAGGLQLGTSIYGGWKASQAAKKAEENNQNWYNRRYNEDSTQRADAQRMLQLTQERMRAGNKAAQGSAAVMGATEESVAATKAANAQAMADAAGQIAASGAARQDAIEQQYRTTQNALDMQRAQNIAQATKGAASAMGAIGGPLDDAIGDGGVAATKAANNAANGVADVAKDGSDSSLVGLLSGNGKQQWGSQYKPKQFGHERDTKSFGL